MRAAAAERARGGPGVASRRGVPGLRRSRTRSEAPRARLSVGRGDGRGAARDRAPTRSRRSSARRRVGSAAGVFETSAALVLGRVTRRRRLLRRVHALRDDMSRRHRRRDRMGRGLVARVADVDVESGRADARSEGRRRRRSKDPSTPGAYKVVLEPPAMAMLIDFLSYMGFGAKQMIEGESFLLAQARRSRSPRRSVTIADDVCAPAARSGSGSTSRASRSRRSTVIDEASRHGRSRTCGRRRSSASKSTGHASGSNEFGPYASQHRPRGRGPSLDELIAGRRATASSSPASTT